jgi:predicted methyltransferase
VVREAIRVGSARITELAHDFLRPHLRPGDIAIDATAGNGHDTRFIAQCVGPTGVVFALDIQTIALERTAALCAGFDTVHRIERSHADMKEAIPFEFHGRIAAVMFNFGYLPGGDKSIVTATDSSVAAVRAAAALLRPGGCLTAIVYPGHPGGEAEAEAVEAALRELPFAWECRSGVRADSPRLWMGRCSRPL